MTLLQWRAALAQFDDIERELQRLEGSEFGSTFHPAYRRNLTGSIANQLTRVQERSRATEMGIRAVRKALD